MDCASRVSFWPLFISSSVNPSEERWISFHFYYQHPPTLLFSISCELWGSEMGLTLCLSQKTSKEWLFVPRQRFFFVELHIDILKKFCRASLRRKTGNKVVCVSLFLLSYSGLGLQGGWVIAIIPLQLNLSQQAGSSHILHPLPLPLSQATSLTKSYF